jgi:acetyl-CoA C-acetyltransferase
VAEKFSISRQEQDDFALHSQKKAVKAEKEGRYLDEIVAVSIPQRKGEALSFTEDEYIKPDVTPEKLAALKPVFKKDGTVTAGNASGINDGAACVILASEKFVKGHNIKPFAVVAGKGSVGVDPAVMGLGPVPSTRKALASAGVSLGKIDLIEANEAFAAQSIAVVRELEFDIEKVNVNGGAIALGHPIGASGARILVTLLHELRKRDLEYGLATLCIGGGMGETLVVQRDHRCK